MATYNNKHWLLSHIRNSFISTDDTGMCETVMLSEDLPSQYASLNKYQKETPISSNPRPPEDYSCYPGLDQSDDEDMDQMWQSFDIQMDQGIGFIHRSNTAQKLEQMNLARKKASKIRNVKCDDSFSIVTEIEKSSLFVRKEVNKTRTTTTTAEKLSLLSDKLSNCPIPSQNKFLQYAKFDGTGQTSVPTKTIKIFLTMLPERQRNYPMQVCVAANAKIHEFIGLICYKCSIENPEIPLLSVRNYGLYITEEDGEIDMDFPPLDQREPCSKFCFSHLALVERNTSDVRLDTRTLSITSEQDSARDQILQDTSATIHQQSEDLARMLGHTTMMESPVYRSYRVHIVNGGFFNTTVQLGISFEKFEIDPVPQQKSKFWFSQRAVSHSMDAIACCHISEESATKTRIRIAYNASTTNTSLSSTSATTKTSSSYTTDTSSASASAKQQTPFFRFYDFITTDPNVAVQISEQINNIIEVRSSATRREYLQKCVRTDKTRKKPKRNSFSFKK